MVLELAGITRKPGGEAGGGGVAIWHRHIPERLIDERHRSRTARGRSARARIELGRQKGPVVTSVGSPYYVAAVDPLSSNVAEMSGVCHALIGLLALAMAGHIPADAALVVDSRIAMFKVVNHMEGCARHSPPRNSYDRAGYSGLPDPSDGPIVRT